MGNLAIIYRNQGRWNKARQLEAQVMDMTRKLHGEEHSEIFQAACIWMPKIAKLRHRMRQINPDFKSWIKKKSAVVRGAQ